MENIVVKKRMSIKARKNLNGYIFIAPALFFFVIFVIIPLCMSFFLSLFRTDMMFEQMTFIGLKNFTDVFKDKIFGQSLINILMYTLMAVPMNVVISLLLALALNSKFKGTKIFRTLFYLPSITSAIAASLVWMWLMNYSLGLLNEIITSIGLPPFTWLTNSKTALFSVTLVSVWMGIGGNMIIFLAALQGLPEEIYEAGKIDGAGPIRLFFKMTIPMILPTMYFILTMTLIGSFQLYDQVFVLTEGGPANSTITPVYLIWQNAFGGTREAQAGYAAAQSIVLFAIIMVVTVIVKKFNKENV